MQAATTPAQSICFSLKTLLSKKSPTEKNKKKKNKVYVNQNPDFDFSTHSIAPPKKMIANNDWKIIVGITTELNFFFMKGNSSFPSSLKRWFIRKPLMKKNSGSMMIENKLLKLGTDCLPKEKSRTCENTTMIIVTPRIASRYPIRLA